MKINDLLPKVSDKIFAQHLETWRNMWGGTDSNPSGIDDSQSASAGLDDESHSSFTYGDQP